MFNPDSALYAWLVLPALIFLARIADVSLGTIRIIAIGRGRRAFSTFLGFFEVFIWIMAISQVMKNVDNAFYYIVYAGGFAAGTYVGMWMEEKLAFGVLMVKVITRKDASELIEYLKIAGYGVTAVEARGNQGPVHVIYTIIKRGALKEIISIIRQFNEKAFYLVEDVRSVDKGIFPLREPTYRKKYVMLLRGRNAK